MSDFLTAEGVIETGIQKVRAIADLLTVLENGNLKSNTFSWIGIVISDQMDDMNNALEMIHALFPKQL